MLGAANECRHSYVLCASSALHLLLPAELAPTCPYCNCNSNDIGMED